jgi:hypothetical protein
MSRAKDHNDLMMLKILNKPDFLASAVYHSGCIRRLLLHSTPLKVEFKETEQSAHEVAFYIHSFNEAVLTYAPRANQVFKARTLAKNTFVTHNCWSSWLRTRRLKL